MQWLYRMTISFPLNFPHASHCWMTAYFKSLSLGLGDGSVSKVLTVICTRTGVWTPRTHVNAQGLWHPSFNCGSQGGDGRFPGASWLVRWPKAWRSGLNWETLTQWAKLEYNQDWLLMLVSGLQQTCASKHIPTHTLLISLPLHLER